MLNTNAELNYVLDKKYYFMPRTAVQELLSNTLASEACQHVMKLIPEARKSQCELHVYVLWDFPSIMRGRNKRSIGKTWISREGDIYIVFSVKLFVQEGIDWTEIKRTAWHESFHAAQERWMWKHSPNLLEHVLDVCALNYNNPMEEGAYAYEKSPDTYRQDFRIFLHI